MTRLGVYGGTFDPIHNGHIEPVLHAVGQLELERVLYLPTATPPHKTDCSFAPALRRFAMVELAVLDYPRLQVSDFELGAEPSYTIDSVEHFRRETPDVDVFLVLGSDSLARIENWHRWSDLLCASHLAVLQRPNWSCEQALAELSPATRERLESSGMTVIKNAPCDVSATEVRRRMAAGESVPAEWLPSAVVEYARKYCLYS